MAAEVVRLIPGTVYSSTATIGALFLSPPRNSEKNISLANKFNIRDVIDSDTANKEDAIPSNTTISKYIPKK
jgi:hypothetical protein